MARPWRRSTLDSHMAYLRPAYRYGDFWSVETTYGTEFVPVELIVPAGTRLTVGDVREHVDGDPLVIDDEEYDEEGDAEPCQSDHIVGQWFYRLIVPDNSDCTPWHGPYETEAHAKQALADEYDVDPVTGAPGLGGYVGIFFRRVAA